jgi:hypothetical protein
MSYALANYTPHPIHLHTAHGSMTLESLGEARAAEITTIETETIKWDPFADGGMVDVLPLATKRYGDVTGLPAPRMQVLYIVSTLVQQACPERTDLVSPDQVIRDESGRVIGCKGLYRLAR